MPNDRSDPSAADEPIEGKLVALDADASTVALLNRSEIDMQIATAKKYPRSVAAFQKEAAALALSSEEVAAECSYALPRKDRKTGQVKTIEGPSARFAEILAYCWGNSRGGARIVDEQDGFIVAQGAFMDLQKNNAVTYEVRRSIQTSEGRRYSADMVQTTGNAASSIAMRNAVLKGIPKALWIGVWEAARQKAIGDATTLANRRGNAIKKLAHYGVGVERMLQGLGRKTLEEVTLEDLMIVLGVLTRLKENEITPEQAFSEDEEATPTSPAVDAINSEVKESGAQPGKAARETVAKQALRESGAGATYPEIAAALNKATDAGAVDDAESLIDDCIDDAKQKLELHDLAKARRLELK